MPRGHPDYNEFGYAVAGNKDVSDQSFIAKHGLAPVTGLGRVYLSDFFEDGFNGWILGGAGGGLAPTLIYTNRYSLKNGLAVVLDPVANGGSSFIQRDIFTSVETKQGIELFFVPRQGHGSIDCLFTYSYGTNDTEDYYFGYNQVVQKWYAGNNTNVGYFKTEASDDIFYERLLRFKFVFDIPNRVFDKLFLGDATVDISTHTPANFANGYEGQSIIQILISGVSAVYKEPLNLCGFIWTVDEP